MGKKNAGKGKAKKDARKAETAALKSQNAAQRVDALITAAQESFALQEVDEGGERV